MTSSGSYYEYEWYEVGAPGAYIHRARTDSRTRFRNSPSRVALALVTDKGYQERFVPSELKNIDGYDIAHFVETCNPFVDPEDRSMVAINLPLDERQRKDVAQSYQEDVEQLGYDTTLQLDYAPYQFTSQITVGVLYIHTLQ